MIFRRLLPLTFAVALLACASLAFAQTGPTPGSGGGGGSSSALTAVNTGTPTNITGVLTGDGATISGSNPLAVSFGGTATTTTTNGYVKIATLLGVATYTVQVIPFPQTDGGTATTTAINAFFVPRVASASGANVYAASSIYDDGTTVTFVNGAIRANGAGSATAPNYGFNPGSGGAQNGFYSANGAIGLTVGGTAYILFNGADTRMASSNGLGWLSGVCCGGTNDVGFDRASASTVNVNNGTVGTATGWITASGVTSNGVPFSGLGGSRPNGSMIYCTNCNIANPCTVGGTGAIAKRLAGAWVCN